MTNTDPLDALLHLPASSRARPAAALIALAMLVGGCDREPASAASADGLATQHGIDADVATRLLVREPLASDEVDTLARSGQRDVLVPLMAHPSTPPSTLAAFASYPDDAVRDAIAANASTPTPTLRFLRVPGRATPANRALAMNPSTPVDLLLEMRAKGEAGDVSLAANASLPADVMRDIHRRGDEVAKLNLARNPAVPNDLREALARDQSASVRDAAAAAAARR